MTIQMQRETLLAPLEAVMGVVERRHTLPILANVLLEIEEEGQYFSVTATDLEVQLKAKAPLAQSPSASNKITVSGRKLMDICRSLPSNANIELIQEKDRLILRSGRSRFSLATLPADDFPALNIQEDAAKFPLTQKNLRYLTQRTHFAMAQQDVRYYLNGMLLEVNEGVIRAVATDGHRLALNTISAPVIDNSFVQVILPRKGIMELMRLLEDNENEVSVHVSSNHVRITAPDFIFISKLVDGRFPDYEKVLPQGGNKSIIVDRNILKQALTRASILSNEKFRGVRLQLRQGLLRIIANNPDQEEAEEEISVEYNQEDLEIGINVTYLLDILNTVDAEAVVITFSDANSSLRIEEHASKGNSVFVVMPMRL